MRGHVFLGIVLMQLLLQLLHILHELEALDVLRQAGLQLLDFVAADVGPEHPHLLV